MNMCECVRGALSGHVSEGRSTSLMVRHVHAERKV